MRIIPSVLIACINIGIYELRLLRIFIRGCEWINATLAVWLRAGFVVFFLFATLQIGTVLADTIGSTRTKALGVYDKKGVLLYQGRIYCGTRIDTEVLFDSDYYFRAAYAVDYVLRSQSPCDLPSEVGTIRTQIDARLQNRLQLLLTEKQTQASLLVLTRSGDVVSFVSSNRYFENRQSHPFDKTRVIFGKHKAIASSLISFAKSFALLPRASQRNIPQDELEYLLFFLAQGKTPSFSTDEGTVAMETEGDYVTLILTLNNENNLVWDIRKTLAENQSFSRFTEGR